MNHSKLHNPVYVGPGIWFAIHTMAADAKTDTEKKNVIHYIRKLQDKFPCGECKGHFGNYLEKHPPEETLGKGEESLFLWTFNFHNAVNFRLKKSQLSYEEAKSIFYTDDVFCSAKCDDDGTSPAPVEIIKSSEKKSSKPSKHIKLVSSDIPLYLR